MRESYQHFARTMLDFFWSPRLTSQNFSRYVEFENRERWDEEDTRPGNPVIVGCYHYSNFEWLSIVSAFAGLEGVVIAQQFKNSLLDPIVKEAAIAWRRAKVPSCIFTGRCVAANASPCSWT